MSTFDLDAAWPETNDPHELSKFADDWNTRQKQRRLRPARDERLDGSQKGT
jgi:hypothetical protein